jgi:beta-lactamase class A
VKRNAFLAATGALLAAPALATAATDSLESIARGFPGMLGVYSRTLSDGPPLLDYNSGDSFPTASTIKVLIMATAFRLAEETPSLLDQTITTRRSDLIGGSDFLATKTDGARFSIRELLRPMIQVSDNTASNYLITALGFQTINDTAVKAGLTQTKLLRHFLDYTAIVHHNDNVTSPQDMGTLLYTIAHGAREEMKTIVSAKHARAMIEIMLGQTDRDGIPAGLPASVRIANKTGEIDGSRNDIAIVDPFGASPYVLAVYTKWLTSNAAAYTAMHRLARLSYERARVTGA